LIIIRDMLFSKKKVYCDETDLLDSLESESPAPAVQNWKVCGSENVFISKMEVQNTTPLNKSKQNNYPVCFQVLPSPTLCCIIH
jgi:hypothetical protein